MPHELKPGDVYDWRKRGPWTIVQIYPWYPTGKSHEYRQKVKLEAPDGEVIVVEDAFIEQWLAKERT